MSPTLLTQLVKAIAKASGFDACHIAPADPVPRADFIRAWMLSKRSGSMEYLARTLEMRLNPQRVLRKAKSLIVLAQSYYRPEPFMPGAPPHSARVAMYAWGADYHTVLRAKAHDFLVELRRQIAAPFRARTCVDTAPMVERQAAETAGLGWIGKNTLVLNRRLGSYFFLAVVVTTLELTPDDRAEDHCGSCTACLDACPTQAFPAPYQMDASRCISYGTIENRGLVPAELADKFGEWIYGCDVCQEVCPFNRKLETTSEQAFLSDQLGPRLGIDEIHRWDDDAYSKTVANSAASRASLEMWKRNAAIVERNVRMAEVQSPVSSATPIRYDA